MLFPYTLKENNLLSLLVKHPPNDKHGDLFFWLGSILYLGAPNISNKNPNIKNNLISNLIKSFLKINYIANNWISKLSPNIPMKTLIKKKKNSISNLIKSLLKIYIKYCQKLDFEAFP